MMALALISFLGLFFLIKYFNVIRDSSIPFFAISTLIVVLYFLGFFNILVMSTFIIFGIGLFSFLLFAGLYLLGRNNVFSFVFTKPAVVFVLGFLFFWFKLNGALLDKWDEVGHWGLMLKEMMIYGRHLQLGDATFIPNYPPGATMLQFYISGISNSAEWKAYFAQAILIFVPLIQLLEGKSGGGKKYHYFAFITSFLLICIFFNGWKTLYVDQAVATYFAGLYIFAKNNECSVIRRMPLLLPMLITLSLIKFVGGMYGLIFIALLLLDYFILNRRAIFNRDGLPLLSLRELGKLFVAISLLYYVPVFAQKIWAHRSFDTIFSSVPYSKEPISAQKVSRVFSGDLRPIEKEILGKFRQALSQENLLYENKGFCVSVNTVFIFFLLCLLLIFFVKGRSRTSLFLSQTILLLSFTGYLFGLLVLYLFRFNEYEGLHLASFSRYVSCFVAGWLIILLYDLRWTGEKRVKFLLLFILLAFSMVTLPDSAKAFLFHRNHVSEYRLGIKKVVAEVIARVLPTQSVYVVWQKTMGFELFTVRYELIPRNVNVSCWSLGTPWARDDVWTCNKSSEELKSDLKQYDFLFLASVDEGFWQEYRDIFPAELSDRSIHLFEIIKNPQFSLRPVYDK